MVGWEGGESVMYYAGLISNPDWVVVDGRWAFSLFRDTRWTGTRVQRGSIVDFCFPSGTADTW